MSYTITKSHTFCYGHRLEKYCGKCRELHGHTAKVDITLRADSLDERGIAFDFSDIKEKIAGWIDATFDHKMLLDKNDPIASLLKLNGHTIHELDCPPSAENLARIIFNYAKSRELPVVSITLWESENAWARFEE